MVYVPLLESLEALLQNDAILAEVGMEQCIFTCTYACTYYCTCNRYTLPHAGGKRSPELRQCLEGLL